ncbi:hypothetical protein DPMN_053677 [Dreissena polymorpha]|uniref:Uncharacterized protein n=1 Tax=Dreissena polymorpha TaxID=45954 RepID=A0A9D4HQH6_DREPO|nr:hypothetical protein DPMN_053677 [Dreissena polymorpha]
MIGHKIHVIQLTGTIFQLNSRIKETNVLTKFHENWAKNVTSRKNAPPTGGHVFSPIWTIFEFCLQGFSIAIKGKLPRPPPTGSHVFQWTGTTFELNQHIIKTNILTNFKLDRDFIGMELLTKFHEDRTMNVASRTDRHNGQRPVTKAHLSNQTGTILEHIKDIIRTNVLTKFHEDWTTYLTSRVLTRKTAMPSGSHSINVASTVLTRYMLMTHNSRQTKLRQSQKLTMSTLCSVMSIFRNLNAETSMQSVTERQTETDGRMV